MGNIFKNKLACFLFASIFASAFAQKNSELSTNKQLPKKCLGKICLGDPNFNFLTVVNFFGKGDSSKTNRNLFYRQRCYWITQHKMSLILGYSSDDFGADSKFDGLFITKQKLCKTQPFKSAISLLSDDLKQNQTRIFINSDKFFYLDSSIKNLKKEFRFSRQYIENFRESPRFNENILVFNSSNQSDLIFNEVGVLRGRVRSYLLSNSP